MKYWVLKFFLDISHYIHAINYCITLSDYGCNTWNVERGLIVPRGTEMICYPALESTYHCLGAFVAIITFATK
jgi:hypothetical protein